MSRRLTSIVAIALAVAVGCGPKSPNSAAPGPAPPSGPPPHFLAQLGGAHASAIYLADPLPVVERALASKTVARFLARPELAALTEGDPPDPAALVAAVRDAAPWIPREAAFGFDDTSAAMVGRFMRLLVLQGLTKGAIAAGERSTRDELPALQDLLLEELRSIRIPDTAAWVRMRTPADAGRLFELAVGVARRLPLQLATTRITDHELTMTIDAAGFVDPDQMASVLSAVRVLSSPFDARAKPMVEAIRQLRIEVLLVHRGDELRLTLGDGGPPGPGATAADATLLSSGGPMPAVWARWDLRPLVPLIASAVELLDRWRDRAAGQAMLTADLDDSAGDVRALQGDLAAMALRGQARLDVGDAGLRVEIVEHDPPPSRRLTETGVLALIPADVPIVNLNAADSLADALASTIQRAENRLASKTVSEDEEGGPAEAAEQSYYRRFGAVRELVLRGSRKVFTPPFAYLVTTATATADVTVELRGPWRDRTELKGLPIIEYAIIGKADAGRAVAWLEAVYRELAVAALATTPIKLPAGARLIEQRDLGLGVPTYALSLAWVGPASGGIAALDLRGDLALHGFAQGDLFVISTSPALSRRILRDDDPPFALPDPALVSYARVSGVAIAAYVDRVAAWMKTVEPDPKVETTLRLVSAGLGAVDVLEWRRQDEGGRRLTRGELRLTAVP